MPEADRHPEISTPQSVLDNPAAIELMRVWWMGQRAEMVFRPAFDDPRAFGFLLAEASRHLAQVYAHRRSMDPAEAHAAIMKGWADGQEADMVTNMERTGAAADAG